MASNRFKRSTVGTRMPRKEAPTGRRVCTYISRKPTTLWVERAPDRTKGLDHDFSLRKSHIDKTALFSCCVVSAFSTRTIVMSQGSSSTTVLSGWRLALVASYSGGE
jgi:hypothetical protein